MKSAAMSNEVKTKDSKMESLFSRINKGRSQAQKSIYELGCTVNGFEICLPD